MNAFHRLTAWLSRTSRTRERRKLYREFAKVTKLREQYPDRHKQYTTELDTILDCLYAITTAEDAAGAEARIEPLAPWPGLPTEGRRAFVVQDEVASRIRSRVIEAVGGLVLTVVILLHLMGQA